MYKMIDVIPQHFEKVLVIKWLKKKQTKQREGKIPQIEKNARCDITQNRIGERDINKTRVENR